MKITADNKLAFDVYPEDHETRLWRIWVDMASRPGVQEMAIRVYTSTSARLASVNDTPLPWEKTCREYQVHWMSLANAFLTLAEGAVAKFLEANQLPKELVEAMKSGAWRGDSKEERESRAAELNRTRLTRCRVCGHERQMP